MKIKVEVEIFDDPEYCEKLGNDDLQCPRLDFDAGKCTQFWKRLSGRHSGFEKCPQCKEAWKKAKNEN